MNIFKLSHAFLAVIMIASCNKMITTVTLEGVGYITVTSQIGSQTKAGYETKNLPSEFVMDIDQNGTDHDYALLNMSRNGSSNTYIANKNDIAWASTDRRDVSVKAMTMPAGVTEINSNGIVSINLLSNQTTLENFNKNDILGAKKADNGGITIKGDNINISFQHLMSKLHVVYETADPSVNVSQITLQGVCLSGEYSYANMTYVSSNTARGDIQMYLNPAPQYSINAAEAIFYPHTGSPTLAVTTDKGTKQCAIVNGNYDFKGGKNYVMKISVAADGSVTRTSISEENDWVKNVPGGKILWVGTSIPAGGGTVSSYPQMIANATGLEVINNAVGGSVVLPPNPAVLDNYTLDNWNYLYAGGLSQSHEDVELLRSKLTTIANNYAGVTNEFRTQWVNERIDELKNLSYDSLIIPYIDGTKDNCNTIVIDHGFNDLVRIIEEAEGFHGWDNPEYGGNPTTQYADIYFEALLNETYLENAGYPNYAHYKLHLENILWPNNYCIKEDSYLLAMEKIISKCREVNPNINIIIGNYFTENNNWLHYAFNRTADKYLGHSYARTLCYYNKAVAKIFNCRGIVNVQDSFKDLTNEQLWSNQYDPVSGAVVDASKFCPDGVHPSSKTDGSSNKAIADVYLQELAKIFVSTKTQSSTYAYDYGWEDVEML